MMATLTRILPQLQASVDRASWWSYGGSGGAKPPG